MDKIEDLLNDEQREIYEYATNDFASNNEKYLVIGGYAGTGKTFLLSAIAKSIYENMIGKAFLAFCSYTGKAVSVLDRYLRQYINHDTLEYSYISTIHSLMYHPEFFFNKETQRQEIVGWSKKDELNPEPLVIFVDEASMITKDIWKDLLSYNVKVIAFGDNFQLPPIGDGAFNLMNFSKFKLEKIQRQAENSPIINLSMFIRKNGYIPTGKYSENVFKASWDNQQCKDFFHKIDLSKKDNIVLCGFNKTRSEINLNFRKKLQYKEDILYPGDKIICLRNNYDSGLKNGQQGCVLWAMNHGSNFFKCSIEMYDFDAFYDGVVYKKSFGKETYDQVYEDIKSLYSDNKGKGKKGKSYINKFDLFDFSYAISVHKSQASEFDNVVIFEQRSQYWDDEHYARWLYTGVTRAKKSLFVISGYW